MSASEHLSEAALAAGAKATAGMTHGGATLTIFGGLTLNELAVVVGIVVSVAGLIGNWVITWHWKRAHYQLERERMEKECRSGVGGE